MRAGRAAGRLEEWGGAGRKHQPGRTGSEQDVREARAVETLATWNDFQKLDIRVGRVVDVQDFPEARKPAYKLTIDFGPLGLKRSSAQITDRYTKEDLMNRLVVAVVNFPPKQIATFMSEVLVLGAMEESGVVLLRPDHDVELGTKIG